MFTGRKVGLFSCLNVIYFCILTDRAEMISNVLLSGKMGSGTQSGLQTPCHLIKMCYPKFVTVWLKTNGNGQRILGLGLVVRGGIVKRPCTLNVLNFCSKFYGNFFKVANNSFNSLEPLSFNRVIVQLCIT